MVRLIVLIFGDTFDQVSSDIWVLDDQIFSNGYGYCATHNNSGNSVIITVIDAS